MSVCPTDDTLGALVEHALDEGEVARVSSHIDECEACRAAVVAAVRPAQLAKGTPSLPFIEAKSDPEALVGTRMGRYEIRSLLGTGGMGQVYAAYDAELDRSIALKVLRPELARAASVLAERLLRESRAMAKVAHPAVITVYDVGREGDAVFIAMELIRGETLAAHLARTKPGWREIAAIFERAAQGLAAAHDAGLIHRDFKPDNVLVDGAKVVVTDFGIAMIAALADAIPTETAPSDVRLTATGAAIGTPAYMAPEQLAGGAIDRRADVFAFSVSLWEALFGERPFPGNSLEQIKAAMRTRPRAPRSNVPARLVRALERGLAIDPAYRWPDMHGLVAELAAVRSTRRRTIALVAAGGAALVGASMAGVLMLSGDEPDPCATSIAVDTAGLALDPATQRKLADNIAAWGKTHAATCRTRAPAVTACLDARRLEIEAFVDDARRDGGKASMLTRIMVDPARCADPPPALLFARVPAAATERRAVTELRYRAFAVESARDRSEFDIALPQARQLVDEAKAAWPPARAELLYLLGTTEAMGSDGARAMETLREAAVLAERTQHVYIAANSWIQLILSAAFDLGDPARALEYASYADAALDKLGRPPELEALFLYHKGSAMLEADEIQAVDVSEAEALLRRAVDVAQKHAPQYAARTMLGLGYALENRGRYADAVDAYRRALRELESGGGPATSAHTFRERLAVNLSLLGKSEEAERVMREAVALAEATLGEDSVDRAVVYTTLAQVLSRVGKGEEALAAVRRGDAILRKVLGERNVQRGEVLSLEGNILVELGRPAEAAKVLAKACEVIAYRSGEDSGPHAECLLAQSIAVGELGRGQDGLALVERAVDALIAVDGDTHPRVASALVQRGITRHFMGKTDAGIADLERAIEAFETLQLEPGHLGGAKWALGQALWKRDRPRARKLVEEAIALFGQGAETWATSKADAEAFLRTAR